MAQPASRQDLIDYALRQNGAPVLEFNVAEEQLQDLMDDAIQYYQERHYDGITKVFLKYKITQEDIDRGRAKDPDQGGQTGITTTTATTTINGESLSFDYYENSNFLQIPPNIIGVEKIFKFDSAKSLSMTNMFSFKYQLVLNDLYYWGRTELLGYSMAMTYLETLNFLLNTEKQIRFNIRQNRLYLDIDYAEISVGDYIIINCSAAIDPDDFTRVYNDPFLKRYLTALVKRQWGMNLIKFQGVKLPGGTELNGRQIYDDGQREIDEIRAQMLSTYEIPPLDFIG